MCKYMYVCIYVCRREPGKSVGTSLLLGLFIINTPLSSCLDPHPMHLAKFTNNTLLLWPKLTWPVEFSLNFSYLSINHLFLIAKQGGRGLLVLYQKANVWQAVCLHLCSMSHRVSQFIIKWVCVRAHNLFCPLRYPSMPLWVQRRPSSGVSALLHVERDRERCVISYMDTVTSLSEEPLLDGARLSLVNGPV